MADEKSNKEEDIYREEVECWIANQSLLTIFVFAVSLLILVAGYPFFLAYWKIKFRWQRKRW